MSTGRIQYLVLLGQARPALSASREMLAYLNHFGSGKPLADRVERKRIVGNVLVMLARRAHQILDPEAHLESIRNRAAIAHFAEDHVAVQLHLHLFASTHAPGNGDPQAGTGDVQNRAIKRLRGSGKDLDLGWIMRLIARLASPFDHLCGGRLWHRYFRRGKLRDIRNGVWASSLYQTVS